MDRANEDCVREWNQAWLQFLERAGFPTDVAEDVTQDLMLNMCYEYPPSETKFPLWQGSLPVNEQNVAIQRAKTVKRSSDRVCGPVEGQIRGDPCSRRDARRRSGGLLKPVEGQIQCSPVNPEQEDRESKTVLKCREALGPRFTEFEIERMLMQCSQGSMTQKALAESAGIPYRTFKDRVKKLRHRPKK